MNKPQTAWIGKPPNKKQVSYVDPATLTIANDPIPASRAAPEAKYEGVFSRLKPGQCIVCESKDAAKIGHALNTWLERRKKSGDVRTTTNYPADGKGRVWLLDKKAAK
jgi:hypothetical protein